MYKSFWMGYCQIFKAMAEILKRKQEPDVEGVTRELMGREYDQRYNQYYSRNGGLVEYGLDAIIKRSEGECVSDESFFEVDDFKAEHDALPEMKDYDFNYDMVWEELCASTCMVFELSYGGPYRTDDEDDPDEDLGIWYQKQCTKTLNNLVQQFKPKHNC